MGEEPRDRQGLIIFAGIGVELEWSKAMMNTRSCIPRIVARLEVASGPDERPDSLAYASVGVRADR